MDASQFNLLLKAIDRNTEALVQVAQTNLAHSEQIARLADECVQLATMLADPESEAPPQTDLAGRPLGPG